MSALQPVPSAGHAGAAAAQAPQPKKPSLMEDLLLSMDGKGPLRAQTSLPLSSALGLSLALRQDADRCNANWLSFNTLM